MQRWIFLLTALVSPLLAALPPFAQSTREIQALLADHQLQVLLGSAEGIREIVRTARGYVIVTGRYALHADIEYLPTGRPGPASFCFHFYEPIPIADAGRE